MATLATAPPASRKLYPHAHWYFLLAIAITWLGFSRSYFMRLGEVTIFHHIHGAIAGLWIASLIAQPILYQRGKMRLHRRIGNFAAYVLAPAMVIGGAYMLHYMLGHMDQYPPGIPYTLGYLDMISLVQFPLFVFLGIYFVRDLGLHARWIACTVLILLPPAITRALFFLPWIHGFSMALNVCFTLVDLVLVVLVLDDRRYGRIRAPYPIALAMFLAIHVSMNFAGQWQWWHTLADWYGKLGS